MKGIKFWRLVWALAAVLYTFAFFKKMFTDALPDSRALPIAFFSVMILWMAVEFYFEMPFFQAGIVPERGWCKILFALFFYPFLAFCVADFTWLHWTQVRLPVPVLNWFGVVLFFGGCIFRLFGLATIKTQRGKKLWHRPPFTFSRHPRYLATAVQVVAIPFVFSSYLGMVFALAVGLPIILGEVMVDDRRLAECYAPEYDGFRQTIPLLFPFRKKQ